MDNNENNVKNKESKLKKVLKGFNGTPKIVKWIIFILIGLIVYYLGIRFSDVYSAQTKTTKLGFEDVGELVTQTGYLTVIKDNEEHREFFKLFELPFTESRQIFSYDIEVDASVDFAKISYEEDAKKLIEGLIKSNSKYKEYKINYEYIGG